MKEIPNNNVAEDTLPKRSVIEGSSNEETQHKPKPIGVRRSDILSAKISSLPRANSVAIFDESKEFVGKEETEELSRSRAGSQNDSFPVQPFIDSHPEWNRKFQKAVREVNKLFNDRANGDEREANHPYSIRNGNEDLYSYRRDRILKKFSKLADLYCNFIDAATWYGKIIISERYLPAEHKTIKPSADLGGIAGGEKYIVHNIIFKFCTDHVGLFGSDHTSQKLASLELKGLIHMFNHGSKVGLCVPMMTVLDYKGFKLIAMSRLPVKGNQTLVYGSRDAGVTILNDAQFSEKLRAIGQELGLKPHKVKPAVHMGGSGDAWISGSTDNVLGRSSETAPVPNEGEILMYTPVDLEGHRGLDGRDYLLDFSRIFPPEAPDRHVRCSHLFRLFRPEFVKLYSSLYGPLSPDAYSKFSRGTDSAKFDNSEIEKATAYLHDVQIPKCVQQLKSFVSIDPFAFVESFHRNGVNFRHFGNARRLLLSEAPSENRTKWTTFLLIEMLARTAKNELGHLMRCQVDHATVPGDQKLKYIASNYLNVLIGDSHHSHQYWNRKFKEKLLEYFPNALSEEEQSSNTWADEIRVTENICLFLKRAVQLSGIRLTAEATTRLQNRENFAFEFPLDETDIEAIVERVKNMSLAAYAKGYTFQMKAIHSRNEKEARKFYLMAISKFKMALAMEPDHIDSLLQIFDAVVFLGFNNVAQSLYNTLISIAPHSYLFLYKYATFCEKIRRLDLAEENYLTSLEQNPNYIMCLIAYAKYLSDKGDFDDAELFFHRALKICDNNCYVIFNYASFLYQKRKDIKKANEHFLKALRAPKFESLDEILLLQDYGRFLRDVLHDEEMADQYLDSFREMKEKWEETHDTTVEYPKYKSRRCEDIASEDYGYTM